MELNYLTQEIDRSAPVLIAAFLNGGIRSSLQSIVERHFPDEGAEKILKTFLPSQNDLQSFRRDLSLLVNEWIDSGRRTAHNGSISDSPWDRMARMDLLEVFGKACSASGSPRAVPLKDGRVRFDLYVPTSIAWKERRTAVSVCAIWWYVMLLDSPRRECFGRCDHCGEFFVRNRTPARKRPNKLGTFCPRHRSERKGKSVKQGRQARKDWLVGIAAKHYADWSRQKRRERAADWIAEKMRSELRCFRQRRQFAWVPIALSSRWIVRNEQQILRESRRG